MESPKPQPEEFRAAAVIDFDSNMAVETVSAPEEPKAVVTSDPIVEVKTDDTLAKMQKDINGIREVLADFDFWRVQATAFMARLGGFKPAPR